MAADFNVKPLEPTLDFDHLRYWDVVIIGAGPAGLAAGLTTAHRALTTLVIEAKGTPGGQPQFLYADKRIVDIPGFPDGITGEERFTFDTVTLLGGINFVVAMVGLLAVSEIFIEAEEPFKEYKGGVQ